ncbi:hypothetical protein DCAR_0209042 [Daucus carota subsp. sativus]|uniref:Protein kinase domain-containing protein n=1 Tax=Daucus carota subsp. sativus TaxID=79200 RepID=A0AAF1AP03_DAUCS|nr:hypothetical protein DCAR_0209042 [Daucus carota subsp. sativus]
MGFQVIVDLLVIMLVLTIRGVEAAKAEDSDTEECWNKRCSHRGPDIRFPFWLKDRQPAHCGYPGFGVSCHRGQTLLEFQYLANTSLDETQLFLSKNISVQSINYSSQEIVFVSHQLTNNLKLVNLSNSSLFAPTHFENIRPSRYAEQIAGGHYIYSTATFVSCSSRIKDNYAFYGLLPGMLTSVSGQTFPVYSLGDVRRRLFLPSVTSCTKVFDSTLTYELLEAYNSFVMKWSTPNCGKCEARGQYCKLMKNSNNQTAGLSTICFSRGAIILVLVLVVLLYYLIRTYRQRKYDELKIEMFLADYQAMKPTRYSYVDIKKITGNFRDKLGQGGYGSVYKGQITSEIFVAVKVLNSDPKANGEDFINEVGTIGRIYHVNVVRLVGYCADGCNRALVYEFQPNNSLEKFTYSGKTHQNNFLGWEKMEEIALGIAKGIDYLHQGCAQQILHFDIKPHNILLDHNFNPKISDFGLAKLCSKDQSIVSMTMARGTIGYIAPEVFSRNFGKVSSKSDVYSFGMLLLEMVGARNNNSVENSSETYFPEWIFHHLEEGGEVAIQIEKEEDSKIAKKLTIVGLWCIGWHPVDRPSMKHVVHLLESKECPSMPPNPFGKSSVRSFTEDLEVISESN